MTKARDLSKLLSTANGKIAGANLDVSFENISDTGTAGTKVASGTTGQRGSTAGQIRFNTTTGLAEYYTGTDFKIIDSPPTITAISPLEVANLAGGNETFTITGTNFQSGAVVKFIGNDGTEISPSSTTINSSTSITAVIAKNLFNNAKEPYDVRVTNITGLSSALDNVVNVDNTLSWVTASGTLATITTLSSGTHSTVSATDPDGDTVTYAETGGTVLTTAGLTLNSSTGAISGTPSSTGTKTFTIRATANSKTADRQFSIVVVEAYSSSYLVIAGGGGCMGYGGGGAGGYRNSFSTETSGRNSSTETPLVLQQGLTYTITVGAGGTNSDAPNFNGNGSNSSISGSNITTVTSLGGGGGRSNANTYNSTHTKARDGGSGSGCTYGANYNGVIGFGTAGQGFDGGIGNDGMVSTTRGGGGGGAGANGQDATGGSAGTGGAGLSSSITGSSIGRAGGGNGMANSGSTDGTGYFGGGGATSFGTVNTGGGAGGGSTNGANAGGSGVVILRMLTSKYSGTKTGSPTVSTSGTDTILTFNGSGSYTA
jgi:hypothetical protein